MGIWGLARFLARHPRNLASLRFWPSFPMGNPPEMENLGDMDFLFWSPLMSKPNPSNADVRINMMEMLRHLTLSM